jgi:hypothetical protein
MDLYLMQHGQATTGTEDPERPSPMPVERRCNVSLKEPGLLASGSAAASTAESCAQSRLIAWVVRYCRIMLAIVRKPEGQRTFEVLPRRWVVERTLSWLMRWRRLDRDYERLPTHSEAMVKWAMIGLMARRLAPPPGRRPWQPAQAP